MKINYVFDGAKVAVLDDGDSKSKADDKLRFFGQTQRTEANVKEPSEMGDFLRELNNDEKDEETGMSGIDLRSRLHPIEISAIVAWDTLVAINVLPSDALFLTRQKKRVAVSEGGKGREEIVDSFRGKTEKTKESLMDKAMKFTGMK